MDKKAKSLLSFNEVTKVYPNGKVAVKEANLEILEEEVFGLLGPNGAGKTTSIKMLLGILVPSKGRVLFRGEDIWNIKGGEAQKLKSRFGYLSENPVMYQRLTPREYLTFIGELYDLKKKDILSRIGKYLAYFNLRDRQNDFLERFSWGMLKKVALIASIIGSPEVVILDEPFTDLDPESIYLVKKLILDLKEEGRGVVLSTHLLDLASQLVDRVGIIHEGRILFCGREDELREELNQTKDTSLEKLFLRLTKSKVVS